MRMSGRNNAIVNGIETVNERGELVEAIHTNDMDEYIILTQNANPGLGWNIHQGYKDKIRLVVPQLKTWREATERFEDSINRLESSASRYFSTYNSK